MKRYLADTNILLRFLTGEPEALAGRARELVERCESGVLSLRILPIVVAEVVFVLSGRHYRLGRETIARELTLFLENPDFEVDDRDALILSLEIFAEHTIDYADAYLAAVARVHGCGIASFDRDFGKIPDLDRLAV